MRWFLVLLAMAYPVAMASQSFWSLVAMEYGALPTTFGYADGTQQEAILGPKAPWPDWALVPEGAALEVGAWYGDSPNRASTGYGNLEIRDVSRETALAYRDRLRAEGWVVDVFRYEVRGVEPPFGIISGCAVMATGSGDDTRQLYASFYLTPRRGAGSIHWATRPPVTWALPRVGPC